MTLPVAKAHWRIGKAPSKSYFERNGHHAAFKDVEWPLTVVGHSKLVVSECDFDSAVNELPHRLWAFEKRIGISFASHKRMTFCQSYHFRTVQFWSWFPLLVRWILKLGRLSCLLNFLRGPPNLHRFILRWFWISTVIRFKNAGANIVQFLVLGGNSS